MVQWNRIGLLIALVLVASDGQAQSSAPAGVDTATVRAHFREQAARHPRTAWLRKNASPIRSIDPLDEDFSDLEPLRRAIGEARVVMLGEQTHGDGSTFLAKARLVRFLHQKMGFEVLAIESPMYDLDKAWRHIQQGVPVAEALQPGLFGIWRTADQFAPVIEYVERQARLDRPLILAGFDSQSHLQFSKDSLAADLQGLLRSAGMSPEVLAEGTSLRSALTEMTHRRAVEPWVIDTLRAMAAEVTRRTAGLPGTDRLALMRQVLVSLPSFARQSHLDRSEIGLLSSDAAKNALYIASEAIRDEQMARNLVWLVQNQYPGKRVIVWAATGHTRYHSLLLDDTLRNRHGYAAESAPMGQWLRHALGNSVYSVMFTSYTGSAYAPGWDRAYPIEIHTEENARPELDFEDWMNAAGFRYAFLDLRQPRRGGEWLRGSFVARPWSHVAIVSRWAENTDALFFIQRGRSATRGCPLYRERELGTIPVDDPSVPAACLPE